ncbi:hypothetical protein [Bradyrhizobium sp. 192]|uniref:hypothetical protein n=1 Tax=Bradyrhizobium sp. 192 TaxID=2782660 RepID=UPI001FFF741F|nr:hypothetical protein [Bradyrhizobium sp. 192]UPJ55433.1 hypothetical protein IVB24_22510 [Bradyrhizobium sp. 192]
MPEFRAYFIDEGGHITQRIDLPTDDEAEAREQAQALVDGQAVELWDGARRLVQFEANKSVP